MARWLGAALAAATITFGLFYVMQLLIAGGRGAPDDRASARVIELTRIERETDVEHRRRLTRPEQPRSEPPPPVLQLARSPKPRSDLDLGGFAVDFDFDFALAGGPGLGPAPGDAETTPLVRVPPQYPPRAQERGIEGWVLVEFTISPRGTVVDPRVLSYYPSPIFNQAALRAIRRWKYNPKIAEGKPVSRPGVKVKLDFELDNV